ncbi:hypothetical protein BC455_18195 [Vibrio harveyi]|nr:hypothetical protein BC455_18195 [Vibrio harveyi]
MSRHSLKTQKLGDETLYLTYIDNKWELTIVPANRHNGTERYDGWFPRYYTKVSSAKAAVTRKLGREWIWEKV